MDNIVNYFVLAFIFVFDPLAVLLLISANKAFELKKDETDYLLSSKANKEHLEESIAQADEAEERMDIIGQNGNDGLHYEEDIYDEDDNEDDDKKEPPKRPAYWT